jgi:hypothetical protein
VSFEGELFRVRILNFFSLIYLSPSQALWMKVNKRFAEAEICEMWGMVCGEK